MCLRASQLNHLARNSAALREHFYRIAQRSLPAEARHTHLRRTHRNNAADVVFG